MMEAISNRLYGFSLRHPLLLSLILYLIAFSFRILDSMVLRLDELLGEAILSKALGLFLVAGYVWLCGRKMRDIGFKRHQLGSALLITGVCFGALYLVAYSVQLLLLNRTGQEAKLVLSAVDPKTGMSGGALFAVWLLSANLVNSAMEEGLFRGIMVRHILIRFNGWGAILLQALLFAAWHMLWPVKDFMDGTADVNQAAFQAFSLFVATMISGLVYGYLYLKTDNLWSAFLAHFINNSIFNILFFRTAAGIQGGMQLFPFIPIILLGYLLLIPVIRWAARRYGLQEVRKWGIST